VPATYTVTAEAPGFMKIERKHPIVGELDIGTPRTSRGARHKSERSGSPSLLPEVFEAAIQATAT
jgi:hypothetical protein